MMLRCDKILVVQQDVVDYSNVGACDITITVNIACGDIGHVVVKHVVVDASDVGRSDHTITVDIAHY